MKHRTSPISKFKRTFYTALHQISIPSYSTNKLTQTHSISRTRKKRKESRVSIFSKIEKTSPHSWAQISQKTGYMKGEKPCILFATIIRNYFFEAASRTNYVRKKEASSKTKRPITISNTLERNKFVSLSNTDSGSPCNSTCFERTIEKAPKNRPQLDGILSPRGKRRDGFIPDDLWKPWDVLITRSCDRSWIRFAIRRKQAKLRSRGGPRSFARPVARFFTHATMRNLANLW